METPEITPKLSRNRRFFEALRAVTPSLRSPWTPSRPFSRSQTRQSDRTITVVPTPRTWAEPRPPPPDLDQSVDYVVDTGDLVHPLVIYEHLVSQDNDAARDNPFFALPSSIRNRIYGFCFPEEDRRISLAPGFATRGVWPNDHFASPWDVLENVMGGLGASRAMRRDLMAYFWASYHFHVTLTQFSGPNFSPLSHVWLQDYLGMVQHLTVEIDQTRFGASHLSNAPLLGYNMNKLEVLLATIVDGILDGDDRISMAEFNLMCRRYAGFRPQHQLENAEGALDTSPVPYCPTGTMFITDIVSILRGIVQRSRISGFTVRHTEMLLSAMFTPRGEEVRYTVPEDSPWPTFTSGSVIIPTPRVVSEFEFGLGIRNAHGSARQIMGKVEEDEVEEDDDDTIIQMPSASSAQAADYGYEPSVGTSTSVAHLSSATPTGTVGTNPSSMFPINWPTPPADQTSECIWDSDFFLPPFADLAQTPTPDRNLSTPTPGPRSRLRRADRSHPAQPSTLSRVHRALTPRSRTPFGRIQSPDAMNRLNEQDPAFRRALNAMQSAGNKYGSATVKLKPKPVFGSPMQRSGSNPASRPHTGLGHRDFEEESQKKPSFMGKLKDMFSK